MDVERIYNMLEKLSECAETEVNKGIECLDACEFGQVTDMIKDLSEALYYRTLVINMDRSSTDEVMEMFDRYGDRRYYDDYQYKTSGRYASKGHGSRRSYNEPYYHMIPEDIEEWGDMSQHEHLRDLDRAKGRMYYTETDKMSDSAIRDSREGRAGMMRKGYVETKEMHRGTAQQDKEANMHSLEEYLKELSEDLTGLLADMTPEERQLAKTKVTTLAAKM